jgi:hypothetical protein
MCAREAEFKSILFALCYFHAVVCERRKFGPQGWNRVYPYNTGDLTISVNVLYNYLEANPKVPWEDLRYLFGEIMYGGHITDDWDRKLCRTYLEEYMNPEMVSREVLVTTIFVTFIAKLTVSRRILLEILSQIIIVMRFVKNARFYCNIVWYHRYNVLCHVQLEGEMYLAPGFPVPPNSDYKGYHNYIDENLPAESPYLYGLHPNAEIEFLTTTSDNLFKTIFEMQPRDAGAGAGGGMSREEKV